MPASNSLVQSCPPGAISAIDELPDDLGHLCAIARPRSINQWRGCVHHLRSQQATRIALQGCASALAPQQTGVLFHSFHVVSTSEGSAHHLTFFLPAVGEPLATCCVTAAFASALGSTDLPDPEAAEDLLATRDDELPREYEPKDFERREVGMPIIPSPCHQRVTAPLLLMTIEPKE